MLRLGSRTRTGCLTCRRRKVKCDEARPTCSRCLKFNVVCEGYYDRRRILSPISSTSPPRPFNLPANQTITNELRPSSPQERLHLLRGTIPASPPLFPDATSRADHLSAYHQFITVTVHQLFRRDQLAFWRDEVAKMSWDVDLVYETIQALGSMHRASMIPASAILQNEAQRSRVLGLGAYDNAVRLLSKELRQGVSGREQTLMVVLILLSIFECSLGNPRLAFQHLWAAVQLLKAASTQSNALILLPVRETVMRLDFLAQSVVPYARSSFFRAFPFQAPYLERPFYSSSVFNIEDLGNGPSPDPVSMQRIGLVRLIAAHNDMDKIVWSSFYDSDQQPRRDHLLSFRAELLLWRQGAAETFADYYDVVPPPIDDLANMSAPFQVLSDLPIPALPLHLSTDGAAVTIAYYNCYVACTLAMLSTTEVNTVAKDSCEYEAFSLTYNNLRLAAALLAPTQPDIFIHSGQTPWSCTSLDPGISIPLFLGARRCFDVSWRQYTIDVLHTLGRVGLCDGHALANCLMAVSLVDASYAACDPDLTLDTQLSPLGRLNERTIPLLMPTLFDEGTIEAFYLRHGMGFSGAVAKTTWRQGPDGACFDLEMEWFNKQQREEADRDTAAEQDVDTEPVDPLDDWKKSLEVGWHTFVQPIVP